jgi:hypothetical protein
MLFCEHSSVVTGADGDGFVRTVETASVHTSVSPIRMTHLEGFGQSAAPW